MIHGTDRTAGIATRGRGGIPGSPILGGSAAADMVSLWRSISCALFNGKIDNRMGCEEEEEEEEEEGKKARRKRMRLGSLTF
ncbi:hypothetical protein BHE74_00019504 [Ensete ventricosum]|nr:hypothetical protein BHE74_00019504 [Ensete ventricosum]